MTGDDYGGRESQAPARDPCRLIRQVKKFGVTRCLAITCKLIHLLQVFQTFAFIGVHSRFSTAVFSPKRAPEKKYKFLLRACIRGSRI